MWNLFKVNNDNSNMIPLVSFSVFIANFEDIGVFIVWLWTSNYHLRYFFVAQRLEIIKYNEAKIVYKYLQIFELQKSYIATTSKIEINKTKYKEKSKALLIINSTTLNFLCVKNMHWSRFLIDSSLEHLNE